MAPGGLDFQSPNVEQPEAAAPEVVVDGVARLRISDFGENSSRFKNDGGVQVTCFTEVLDDVTFHFQIILLHLQKQIYAWIGCNSAKFGHLYAAASTRPNNAVSVTSILGGSSDNTGSGIARRVALKTGLNVILACNIPKNSPMLEADAEKLLVQKLINLGYTRSKSNGSSS